MSNSNITIQQTGSAIGRPADQRATLKGLGLNKIGRQSKGHRYAVQPWHDRQGCTSRARRRRPVRITP